MLMVQPRQAANGQSASRVDHLLGLPRCMCSGQCYRHFALRKDSLLQFLREFWTLPKLQQDTYVQFSVAVQCSDVGPRFDSLEDVGEPDLLI